MPADDTRTRALPDTIDPEGDETQVSLDEAPRMLADVPVTPITRLTLGGKFEFLDRFYGNDAEQGVLSPGVHLVTGESNAGKTTLVLDMMGHFAANPEYLGYYKCVDQRGAEVISVANRLELPSRQFILDTPDDDELSVEQILSSNFDDRDEIMAFYAAIMSLHNKHPDRHLIAVVDSLQSLADDSRQSCLRFLKRLIRLAPKINATFIVLGEVTKSGIYAGFESMIHKITSHLHIEVTFNERTAQYRKLVLRKNRLGLSGMCFTNLTHQGHVEMTEVEVNDALGKRQREKEEADEMLKDE